MHQGTIIYDDLYVLQNQYGLIKVGRSANVPQRVRYLITRQRCEIAVVLIQKKKGPNEAWAHRRLNKYHVDGEWFNGNDAARAAVEKLLNKGLTL